MFSYSNLVNPTCESSADCVNNLACINKTCQDPCNGICGKNADCLVHNHLIVCTCQEGYEGDAFVSCSSKNAANAEYPSKNSTNTEDPKDPKDLCNSLSCDKNSTCEIVNGKASCKCLPDYLGSSPNCYRKCFSNADCASNKACIANECQDPCGDSICGIDAECAMKNHAVSCTCPENYDGNPFERCVKIVEPTKREECQLNADCGQSTACVRGKCVDPCSEFCGKNAMCKVVNYIPICTCPADYSGNPSVECRPLQSNRDTERHNSTSINSSSCDGNVCGPHSHCNEINGNFNCTCLPGFNGNPPNCRDNGKEECHSNSDCFGRLACINHECKDPCATGICGLNSNCQVIKHTVVCECSEGYDGDPFVECLAVENKNNTQVHRKLDNACDANPCGVNSLCNHENGIAFCECMPGYHGDPITGCHPECSTDSDCPPMTVCINEKCKNKPVTQSNNTGMF